MTEQPHDVSQDIDISAKDLPGEMDLPRGEKAASSDPEAMEDDGLGTGEGPDLKSPADSGS